MPRAETIALEHEIDSLRDLLARLQHDDDLQELRRLIKQPYWTTPAELLFVRGSLESLREQAQSMARQRENLLAASRLVGQKQTAAVG